LSRLSWFKSNSVPIFTSAHSGIGAWKVVASQSAKDKEGTHYIDRSELILDRRMPPYRIAEDIEDVVAIISHCEWVYDCVEADNSESQ